MQVETSNVTLDTFPERVPASPELAARATALVRQFAQCFWFWHPDTKVRYLDDVQEVIVLLREYGDKRTWEAAKELRKCL